MNQRGDIVITAAGGDYGKPRPAVVIQSDHVNQAQPNSYILALITSTVREAPLLRLTLTPTEHNGLKTPSQIMADKLVTVRQDKIQKTIGQLTEQQTIGLNRILALVTGLV